MKLQAEFQLPGDSGFAGFTEFTFPKGYVPLLWPTPGHNVLTCKLPNGRLLVGVLEERGRGGRACAYFFGDMEPTSGPIDVEVEGFPLTITSDKFAPMRAIGDDPADLFATISSNLFSITFDPANVRVDSATAAVQKFHFTKGVDRTPRGYQVNSEVWVTIGSRAPYFEYEGFVTLSDFENTPDSITVNGLTIDFPEVELVDDAPSSGELTIHAGQKLWFRGRVLAQPPKPPIKTPPTPEHPECSECPHIPEADEGERAESAGMIGWRPNTGRPRMKLKPQHWYGHVGVHGGIVGDPSWPLSSSWTSATGPHMRENPPGTGDAEAFCKQHTDSFYVSPAFHEKLIDGAIYESLRQCAHFETDGTPWDPDKHPSAIFYNSLPDRRLGSDTLSFDSSTWVRQSSPKPQDEAHIELGRVCDAIYLTDSEIPFRTFEDQLKAVLAGLRDRRGQTRSVGRILDVLVYGSIFFQEHAAECRDHAIRKARAWFNSLPDLDWKTVDWFPGTIDYNASSGYSRYLSDYEQAVEPFQNGLALEGFDHWITHDPTFAEEVHPDFQAIVTRVAESLVDEVFEEREFGAGFDYWYTIGWNGDGSKVYTKQHGKNASESSSDFLFILHSFAAVVMTFRDSENDELSNKAARIMMSVWPNSWGTSRFTGGYDQLMQAAQAILDTQPPATS